jgi:peptidoglycan-associated lipoprotein
MKFFHTLALCTLLISAFVACNPGATRAPDELFKSEEPAEAPAEESMKAPAEAKPVQQVKKPVKLSLETIYFGYDRFDLTDEARPVLAEHAKKLKENPGVKILIEGHCDERGTIEYNLALGDKRASAVKEYLVNFGVDPGRISTISYGKERPVSAGHSEESWAWNRRAVFVILE